MRLRLERNRGPIYFAAAVLAAALVLLPTPYSLILPGRAVDLRDVVTVSGRTHDATHVYMTDVTFVPRVRLLGLIEALQPGAHIVKSEQVVPDGQDAIEYEDAMREAMSESQEIAAVVAERAAGLKVPMPRGRLMVVYFSPTAPSKNVLHFGDMILAINGHPTPARANVQRALSHTRPGSSVHVHVLRRGGPVTLSVPTIDYDGRAALGVYLTSIYERPRLPVGVAFHLPKVSGSSAGLMFALDVYRTLANSAPTNERIAGTGTISYDGTVGPIEGARQKVIAAKYAGATLFLVPTDNYADVKGMDGIKIVPVANFTQALAAIGVKHAASR